jgi:hypothetical protein
VSSLSALPGLDEAAHVLHLWPHLSGASVASLSLTE